MNALSNLTTSPSLLEKLRDRGAQEDWTRFFVKYWRLVHGICRRYVNDEHEADDLLQIIFHNFLKRDRFRTFKYEPPTRFRSWLFKVVSNDLRSYSHKKRRRKIRLIVGAPGGQKLFSGLEDRRMSESLLREVQEAFQAEQELGNAALANVSARVEPKTVQVFLAMSSDGLSGAETAARFGMNIDAVYKACSRVARMLEEEYEKLKKRGS